MPLLLQLALFTQNLRTARLEGPSKIRWANPSLHRWGKRGLTTCHLRAMQQDDVLKHVTWGLPSTAVNTAGCLSIPRRRRSGV